MKMKKHRFVSNKNLVSFGIGIVITALIRLHYADPQSHVGLIIAIVIGAVCIICGMVGVFDTE